MEYDVTFLKQLRGLGEHIKNLGGADKITQIIERCIEIKRELNKLEKIGSGGGNRNSVTAGKRRALITEYICLCDADLGEEQIKAVSETARCFEYFLTSMKTDYRKTFTRQ